MKKITLFISIVFAVSALSAQTTFKWNGAQTDQVWDYATANWVDPTLEFPLSMLPRTYTEGGNAIFDDTSIETSDTLKITGAISVGDWTVNAAKTYVIRSTAVSTDSIFGTGTLIKDGTGLLVLDLNNKLKGGTIIKSGKLMMEKQTTPNIFGAKIVFQGGIANFATTTANTYPSISVPIEIPRGVTGRVELSRYSYFASPVSGYGDLTIAAGGDRTMMGTNKAGNVYVNWSQFYGNVTVEPYKMTGVNPGYYAVLLPVTKTFRYETVTKPDSMFATVDTMFLKRKLTLKAGVGLTGASGTRCYAIGELNAEDETAFLGGYGAGNSSTPKVYYMIGASNTDVVCPVSFKDCGSSGYNWTGVIKVGTGTYTFTSTKSITTASMGVQVAQGGFYVNTPIENGITSLGRVRSNIALTINANAFGGGNGRLTGKVQVDSLGTLKVGYKENIGMLVLNDTLGGNTTASPLVVKRGGKIEFKLATAASYDKIITNSTATLNNSKIVLKPAAGLQINYGDKFTLISARVAPAATDTFEIDASEFSKDFSFTAQKDTVGGGYRIIVTAQPAAGIKTIKNNTAIFFPNPCNGILQLSAKENEIDAVEVLNLQGQVVYNSKVNSIETTLNLKSLPAGIYYAKVQIGEAIEVSKIILK